MAIAACLLSAVAAVLVGCNGSSKANGLPGSGGSGGTTTDAGGDDIHSLGDGASCHADSGEAGASGAGGAPALCTPLGTFEWFVNGQHHRSDPQFREASYTLAAADVVGLFDIHIRGYEPSSGFYCELDGRFPALPPPPGTYAIVSPTTAGAFTLDCQGAGNGTGSVVLTETIAGEIAGSFSAGDTTSPATGRFGVGCAVGADCAARP